MAQILKVRPTKIELVKIKRRLGLSQRVKKILKDRLAILTLEFIKTARRAIHVRQSMDDAVRRASESMMLAIGFHGPIALEKELAASEADIKVAVRARNVAGVRIPALTLQQREEKFPSYNLAQTSSLVDEAASAGRDAMRAIIELAEIDRTLELMGAEIRRTKRITNALEYVVIPSMKMTIRFLSMKFEERDREEKARLKRVKLLLARNSKS